MSAQANFVQVNSGQTKLSPSVGSSYIKFGALVSGAYVFTMHDANGSAFNVPKLVIRSDKQEELTSGSNTNAASWMLSDATNANGIQAYAWLSGLTVQQEVTVTWTLLRSESIASASASGTGAASATRAATAGSQGGWAYNV